MLDNDPPAHSLADMSRQFYPDESTGQGVEEDDQADCVDLDDEVTQGQHLTVLHTLQPH